MVESPRFIEQPRSIKRHLADHLPALLIFVSVLIIIILRSTRYFTEPRFWAEEGTLHFAYSYHHSWLQSLFNPQIGYLNFWPNLATRIAVEVPLERAPLVTTLMAMLVQLAPVALILWSTSPLFGNWYRKLAAVLVVIFSPITGEVWLNSVNSYTFFGVITFLILLEDAPERFARRWVYRLLLLTAGLTGTLACFLSPFFIFRAFFERKIERIWQTLILAVCSVLQVILIFSYHDQGNISGRFQPVGPAGYGTTIWTQTIALFAFGIDTVSHWTEQIFSLIYHNVNAFQFLGGLLLAGAMVLFLFLSTNIDWKTRLLFLGSYVTLTYVPMVFSAIHDKYILLQTGNHSRIFLAPNIIFGLMLLIGIQFVNEKGWKAALRNIASLGCLLLISASLFWGVYFYRSKGFETNYWPDWQAEVQTWKANPQHPLKIQPEGWTLTLSPR